MSDHNSPAAEARLDYDGIIAGIVAGMNLQKVQAAAPVAPLAPVAVAPAAAAPAKADEKARVRAILGCTAAKTRPSLAHYLALDKDFDAETSIELLGKAPAEVAEGEAASQTAAVGGALGREMLKAGNSAAIKPEAAGGGAQPSLAEKMQARHAKKGN